MFGGTRSMSLAERGLVEAAQLPRMHRGPLSTQDIDGSQADHEMLADGTLIEGIRRPWQLDLAMQRLVGYAQQGAVGHTQAIALSGDRATLHVHRNGAGEIDLPPLLAPAQLPVPVIVGHDRAGSQPALQLVAAFAGDLHSRLLEGDLDFGESRHRNLRRHGAVENAVAAQVAMREN